MPPGMLCCYRAPRVDVHSLREVVTTTLQTVATPDAKMSHLYRIPDTRMLTLVIQ